MIKLIQSRDEALLRFCDRDVFGTRIKAYFLSYSTEFDFVKFWVQTDDLGNITAAVCRFDGNITVSAQDIFDADELHAFLSASGYITIQTDSKTAEKIGFSPSLSGYVVRFTGKTEKPKHIELKKDYELKEIYDIIKKENLVGVGEYLPWLSDTKHRINSGVTDALVAESNFEAAGCAMKLFETDEAVLLGAVATKPQYRGRGIAGNLVKMLGFDAIGKGKRAELLCKRDSIVEFYKSIGFEIVDEWSIISNETGIF